MEHVGINRISLSIHGVIENNLEYTARLHFYRNSAEVKVDFRLENLNPPEVDEFGQPQANNYGSLGSVNFDDLSIVIPANNNSTYRIPQGELGQDGETTGVYNNRIIAIQESSGDENWNVMQNFAPRLQSGATKRSSTLRIDDITTDGPNQMAGWFDANGVTVAVERVWQDFPKAFRAQNNKVEIGLFPGEFSRNHELRAGEFKTHTFWIRHHNNATDIGARARSFAAPLRLLPSVADIVRRQAAGLLAPRMDSVFPDYETGTDYQIIESPEWRDEYPATTIIDAISKSQNYGWVDYGDIPTDFEGMFSPYNLKYDAVRGMIIQALRNMDNDIWWELASAGARHAADIDIQHSRVRDYTSPRAWYEGGMYGHGYHDEDGRTNPHRNFQNPASYLAGPNAGMFLWALMSGDTLVLDSAIELADNLYWRAVHSDYYADFYGEVLPGSRQCAIDAGLQVCREADCQGYGPADASRTGGNILKAMLAAYLATGDQVYLDLISRIANYVQCYETQVAGPSCDRFHFQTTFVRNLGHYLLFLNQVGLPTDNTARDLLSRRMDYMTNTLWDDSNNEFRMCYDSPDLFAFHDNWLLGVADAFAVGALVLNRPELVNDYGRTVFLDGSKNQFYEGSTLSYHSTKEFVNQVGFGNMFLYAWQQYNPDQSFVDLALTKTDSPDPVNVGNNLTYTITVTNNGPVAATGVVVTDPLPDGVTFVSSSASQGTCSGTSTIICDLGTLANGASATVTIVVTPTAAGEISNTAIVTGNETDPTLDNNTITAATTVTEPCPLSVALKDAPQEEANLEVLYDFRDEVLASTPTGQRYIELFYEHATEGVGLMFSYPELLSHTRMLLERFLPTIQAVVAGREVTVTATDLADMEALLEAFAVKASPELQADLRAIQEELQEGTVLGEFGVTLRPRHGVLMTLHKAF